MNLRRIAIWGIAAAALVVVAALLFPFVALFFVMAFDSGDDMTWDDRRAYVKCEGAIAAPAKWPAAPADACRAMQMCQAEAKLSDNQRVSLEDAMRKAGCR
jgi:hypothetical protein